MLRLAIRIALLIGVAFLSTEHADALASPVANSQNTPQSWLQKFVGTWKTVSRTVPTAGQPAMVIHGTMSSDSIGVHWVVNRMSATMGGMNYNAVQSLGYDEKKARFVGTWIDSMQSFMWHYDGTLDEEKKLLLLEATGPDMTGGAKLRDYRDSYEFVSDDKIVARSEMKSDDDTWTLFAIGEITRVTETDEKPESSTSQPR